jgi:hypothetical protein
VGVSLCRFRFSDKERNNIGTHADLTVRLCHWRSARKAPTVPSFSQSLAEQEKLTGFLLRWIRPSGSWLPPAARLTRRV